jgi:hypothetical protein
MGVESGITAVYSTEKPNVKLLPLGWFVPCIFNLVLFLLIGSFFLYRRK